MNKHLVLALALLWTDSVVAQPAPPSPSLTSTIWSPTFKAALNFLLSNADGKTAVIDFSGQAVTYSGDLPVDEAAKIFFDAVMRQMRSCPVEDSK